MPCIGNRGVHIIQPLSRGLITSAGKAAIAIAGLAWGVSRSLFVPESGRNGATSGSRVGDMEERLARMEAALERFGARSEAGGAKRTPGSAPEAPASAPSPITPSPVTPSPITPGQSVNKDDYITRKDFTEGLERLEKRFANKVGEEMLAIGSLRAMIGDTDVLLARVLERLESMAEYDTAESQENAQFKT